MSRWQRYLLGILTFLLTVGGWSFMPPAAAAGGILDGRVFVVETGRRGEDATGRDVYLFREGRLLSAVHNTRHGFPPAPYMAQHDGDVVRFTADAQSPSRGSIHWEGTVRGEQIDSLFAWRDTPKWYSWRSRPARYWVRSVQPGATVSSDTASHLLDGQVYFVKTGEEGKASDHRDYLIFWEGRFVSSACVELNFRSSGYTAVEEDGGIRFRAEINSPDRGRMVWSGLVQGENAEGRAEWIFKRLFWEVDRHYWFRGPAFTLP